MAGESCLSELSKTVISSTSLYLLLWTLAMTSATLPQSTLLYLFACSLPPVSCDQESFRIARRTCGILSQSRTHRRRIWVQSQSRNLPPESWQVSFSSWMQLPISFSSFFSFFVFFFFKKGHGIYNNKALKIKCTFTCLISDHNRVLNNKWADLKGYGKG